MLKKMGLVVALFSLLAGCGGGGGTGGDANPAANLPAAYTGNTAKATVTASNAKSVSVDAYSGSQIAGSASILAKAVDGGSMPSPLLQEVVGILDGSVSKIAPVQKTTAKVVESTVSAEDTYPGYSGYYSYSINVDTSSGSMSGTLTFSQYKAYSTSIVMNGTIAFSGVFNQTTSSFSSFEMSMTNVTVTGDSENVTLSGKLAASINGPTRTTTLTLAITDSVSHTTTVLKDYTLQLSNDSSLTITGTYFDPVHGYVVISTVTPLTVSSFSDTPTAGSLLFTGSNGTKARLTFTTSGYTVEVDTAGNGTFVLVP